MCITLCYNRIKGFFVSSFQNKKPSKLKRGKKEITYRDLGMTCKLIIDENFEKFIILERPALTAEQYQ